MINNELVRAKIELLPSKPGVYIMKNEQGKVIYVGKAKSLIKRVKQYFTRPQEGKVLRMVREIQDFDIIETPSEKEALLEQYCILTNRLGEEHVKVLFATAYNRYGEGKLWTQGRVRQFFCEEELCISSDFWNLVCKSEHGYEIVIDEYKKNAHFINEALDEIKDAYLPNK